MELLRTSEVKFSVLKHLLLSYILSFYVFHNAFKIEFCMM